jgi:hypothetical protein
VNRRNENDPGWAQLPGAMVSGFDGIGVAGAVLSALLDVLGGL